MTTYNPISCRSCREKKIRCNKIVPRCNKCEASGTECVYLSRRARAKKARPPVTVSEETIQDILERLERLERNQRLSLAHTTPSVASEIGDTDRISVASPQSSENASAQSLSHLVREATNVARAILRQHAMQQEEDQNVLDTLETVAEDVKGYKLKNERSGGTPSVSNGLDADLQLPKDQALRWLTVFFGAHFPIDALGAVIDQDFIMMIPGLLEIPHVHISNASMICYYTCMFQGMILDPNPLPRRQPYFRWMYRKTLAYVEKWQTEMKNTMMDFAAAVLLSWMAREFLDNNLAWHMFNRACSIGKGLGMFMIDDSRQLAANADDDEERKDHKRQLFWYLLQIDCLFRQHFGKPAVIRPGTWNVNFPEGLLTVPGTDDLRPDQVGFIVSTRLALVILKSFDISNDGDTLDLTNIDPLGDEIKSILRDWQVEERFLATTNPIAKWVYADLLINANTTMTLLYRADKAISNSGTIPERSVEAARATVNLMKVISTSFPHHIHWTMEFVSYYPFVSFFTLFYNILSTPDVSIASADLSLNLWLGEALTQWKNNREELGPFETVTKALNKVAQYFLSIKSSSSTSSSPPAPGQENSLSSSAVASLQDWEGFTNQEGGVQHQGGVGVPGVDINFEELLAAPTEYARVLETGIFRNDPHADWHIGLYC